MTLAIIATGVANLASVQAAWQRLGVPTTLTTDAAIVTNAPAVMLPGVGSFGAAMAALQQAGLVPALQARLAAGLPTLSICVGLQVLAAASAESEGVSGLGIFPNKVVAIPNAPRLPQFGWNNVTVPSAFGYPAGDLYFANSFALTAAPTGWQAATTTYGSRIVAALRRGRCLACQFHPELSGPLGARWLQQWWQEAQTC